MYIELKENENFSDTYPTWIIAYCVDINAFFVTNKRHFFWESESEFISEDMAIQYFTSHLKEFLKIRNKILQNTGGWKADNHLYLENINQNFIVS